MIQYIRIIFIYNVLYFFLAVSLTGQTLIASGNTSEDFEHVIFEIDIHTCEERELFRVNNVLLGLTDLVYAPDGYFYGPAGPSGWNLIKLDPEDGSLLEVYDYPTSPDGFTLGYAGITVMENGNLLVGGRRGELVEFDPVEEEFGDVFNFDLPDEHDNWAVSGLGIYKDRVFTSSPSRTVGELNLDDLELDVTFDTLGAFIQALQVLETDCGEPYLVLGTANRNGLIHLYPDRDSFFKACDFSLPRTIFGLTSYTEYKGFPDCRDTIDLNATAPGFDHFQLDECGIGRAFIAHDSAEVYGDFSMDSIRVFLVEEPEPGSGRLESEAHAGIAVSGEGSAELLAEGMVVFKDWESWLRTVEYVDSSPEPLPGLRRIAVVGYFNEGETTDTAWSEIEVLQPDFSAGADVEVEECPTGDEISLYDYLIGADPDGIWEPEVPGGNLELLPDNSGSYYYIVEHPDCGSDTAVVELFVWPGPDVGISGGGTICEGRTTTLSVTGDLDDVVSLLWSDGTTASSIEVSEAGSYWLRLVYGEDCIWTDTVEVVVEETIHMEEELSLCPGEQTEWHGQQIESAGEYETTLPGTDEACDTLLVLTVTETEYIPKEMEASLCPGQELEIEGETIDAPGTYEFVLDAETGCDTLMVMTVTEAEFIPKEMEASLCPGQELEIEGKTIDAPGTYEFILDAETGCDTLLTLEVYARDFEEMQEIISKCPGEVVWYMGEQIEDAGEYEFLLPAADGCDTVVHLLVETYSLPEVEVTGPDLVCEGQQIELRASPAEQLQEIRWSSGETTETIQVSEGGIYGFEALSLNACEVSAEKEIGECPSRQVYIPNAFSPNGDGINDEWTVYPASDPVRMEVQIYDRWGSRVFESSTPDFDWDGTFRGEESPPGVYVFRLTVEFSDGHEEVMSGDFVLVR